MDLTDEDYVWIRREQSRELTRKPPIWSRESFWQTSAVWHLQYPYISETNPRLIAFTENRDKGRRDIQTKISPGRYLNKYFSNVLTPKQIAFYAAWHLNGHRDVIYNDAKRFTLSFATTPQEIVHVYMTGPYSCMDGRNFTDKNNPVRVYGAGDLAVAYLTDTESDKIRARALVWPDKKVCGRIYPTREVWSTDGFSSAEDSEDCATALISRLRAEGYVTDQEGERDFHGARLLKKRNRNDVWMMPYLDHDYKVQDSGEFWTMQECGIDAQNTDGTLADDEDEPYATCECCDEPIDSEHDTRTVYTGTHVYGGGIRPISEETWCESCQDEHSFYCEGINETLANAVEHHYINDQAYCNDYVRLHCFYCDHEEAYVFNDDEKPVEMDNGETWSTSAFNDNGFCCAITNKNYPSDEGTIYDPLQLELAA